MKNKIIINNKDLIQSILLVKILKKIRKLLIIIVYNKFHSKIIRLIEKLLRLITIRWEKEVQSKYM